MQKECIWKIILVCAKVNIFTRRCYFLQYYKTIWISYSSNCFLFCLNYQQKKVQSNRNIISELINPPLKQFSLGGGSNKQHYRFGGFICCKIGCLCNSLFTVSTYMNISMRQFQIIFARLASFCITCNASLSTISSSTLTSIIAYYLFEIMFDGDNRFMQDG